MTEWTNICEYIISTWSLSISTINNEMSAPRCYHFYLFYDLTTYAECLLPAKLCLVTLLTSEQCLQFERFHLQLIQMGHKTSSLNGLAIMPKQTE